MSMNQKLVVMLEVTKGEHTFLFAMPVGAPLGAAYDAAHEMLTEITKMAQTATTNAQPKAITMEQFQEAIDKAN